MKITSFENLEIWRNARELCKIIHRLTSKNDFKNDFALRNQIERSTGSIMDCIAEGFERDGRKEFVQFLSISKGSLGETRSQLLRAFDYKYIDENELNKILKDCEQLSKQIGSLIKYLKSTPFSGHKNKSP